MMNRRRVMGGDGNWINAADIKNGDAIIAVRFKRDPNLYYTGSNHLYTLPSPLGNSGTIYCRYIFYSDINTGKWGCVIYVDWYSSVMIFRHEAYTNNNGYTSPSDQSLWEDDGTYVTLDLYKYYDWMLNRGYGPRRMPWRIDTSYGDSLAKVNPEYIEDAMLFMLLE